MSAGLQGDKSSTQAQLAESPGLIGGKNWLRHSKEAAVIDEMLLTGEYTIEEMARRISPLSKRNAHNSPKLVARVKRHFAHLQEEWNGKMEPHHLNLQVDPDGKWSFKI